MPERILVVDDESGCREGLRRLLQAWGYEADTAISGEDALERLSELRPGAVITDLVMPGIDGIELLRRLQAEYPAPVILLTGQGTIERAVEAIKLGAVDILEKPVEPDKLKILLAKLDGTREMLDEILTLRAELLEHGAFGPLRGVSQPIRKVFEQIEQVAPSKLSVLIAGESGTGKELVAQTLHRLSPRRRCEFIAVNCAAIPDSLLESEIFGHERGAFTGAEKRKTGCFEMAHNGTLFLDEVVEMDVAVQAKLLRVLQEQRFRRLGGNDVIEADVRIVAATNRDPAEALAAGKLREDLYYRLNAFTIRLPPLRERPQDLRLLARHFLERNSAASGTPVPAIDPDAFARLAAHDWPGNVRELKNVIERAALVSRGEKIRVEHLPPELEAVAPSAARTTAAMSEEDELPSVTVPVGATLEDAERELIRTTLQHTEGNKTRAARILAISPKTMHNKVKKYGL